MKRLDEIGRKDFKFTMPDKWQDTFTVSDMKCVRAFKESFKRDYKDDGGYNPEQDVRALVSRVPHFYSSGLYVIDTTCTIQRNKDIIEYDYYTDENGGSGFIDLYIEVFLYNGYDSIYHIGGYLSDIWTREDNDFIWFREFKVK